MTPKVYALLYLKVILFSYTHCSLCPESSPFCFSHSSRHSLNVISSVETSSLFPILSLFSVFTCTLYILGLNYPSSWIVLTITRICLHIHLLPQTKSPLGATMESTLCLQDLTQYLEHSWCSYFSPQDENKYSHSSLLPHGFLAKSYIWNSSEMGNKL